MSFGEWSEQIVASAGAQAPRTVMQTHPAQPFMVRDFSFHSEFPTHIGEHMG